MKLIVVSSEGKGDEFSLEQGSNLIGRWDPENKAFPEVDLEKYDTDAKVSRKHAVILRQSDKALIEDIGSLNGTYINRKQKLESGASYELKNGDEISIGKIFLRFEKT